MKLTEVTLKKGKHDSTGKEMCFMEAVAFFAGEEHTDEPKCVCPVLVRYLQVLNDGFEEEERQLLKEYINKVIETNDGNSIKRAEILSFIGSKELLERVKKLPIRSNNWASLTSIRYIEDAEDNYNTIKTSLEKDNTDSNIHSVAKLYSRNVGKDIGNAFISAANSSRNNRHIFIDMALKTIDKLLLK